MRYLFKSGITDIEHPSIKKVSVYYDIEQIYFIARNTNNVTFTVKLFIQNAYETMHRHESRIELPFSQEMLYLIPKTAGINSELIDVFIECICKITSVYYATPHTMLPNKVATFARIVSKCFSAWKLHFLPKDIDPLLAEHLNIDTASFIAQEEVLRKIINSMQEGIYVDYAQKTCLN